MKTPKEANDMLLESMIEEVRKQKLILKLRQELHELDNLLMNTPDSESEEIIQKIEKKVREINALKGISESDIKESEKRVYERVFGNKKKDNRKVPKKILRNIIIASALLIVLALSVAAARLGVFDGIENIKDLFSKKESTKIEKDGHDFLIASGARTYSTVDEMLKAEKVDILYPIILPKGCNLQSISVSEYEYTRYMFIYNGSMTFSVNNSEEKLILENSQILDYEVTVELCFTEEDNTYTAYWRYGELTYILSCTSKEDIIFILDNMFTK